MRFSDLKALSYIGRIAFGLISPIALGRLGGAYLDRRLGSGPWLTLLGLFLGIFIGFAGLYGMLRES